MAWMPGSSPGMTGPGVQWVGRRVGNAFALPTRERKKEKQILADNKSKTEAEARFVRAQKRAQDARSALTEAEVESRRVDANTARLKALRLARDAADLGAKPAAKAGKAKPAKKAAKGVARAKAGA